MTEREAENQMMAAERAFNRIVIGWGKCPSMCPFPFDSYAYAHWRELEARYLKNEMSRKVEAA